MAWNYSSTISNTEVVKTQYFVQVKFLNGSQELIHTFKFNSQPSQEQITQEIEKFTNKLNNPKSNKKLKLVYIKENG